MHDVVHHKIEKIMVRIIFALLLSLNQLGAHAAAITTPEEVFNNDLLVMQNIADAEAENFIVSIPKSIYLKGSCGFAGCFDTYLVSVALYQNRAVNPQSKSVIAKVTLWNKRSHEVELLDYNQI